MQTVIKVENLSKKFRIGKLRKDSETLRDLITDLIKKPFKGNEDSQETENLWALKNISFEVNQGETLGIIGRNGAGKSTLLKILSRIIKPTSGRAKLEGRVGSLLEIGTGFHQDLTGRENIFLNGAVLGMRHSQVAKRFDEIVAFADLEKFLDTPVKFYSSGMYARLAFAVAAHLEPDILIIDEVLAVGDAAFQAKCLGKMGTIAEGGRTILFVSHSAAMVEKLCKNGLYLENGRIKAVGEMKDVMSHYKADYEPAADTEKVPRTIAEISDGESRFIEWKLLNAVDSHSINTGGEAVFEFTFVHRQSDSGVIFRLMILDLENRLILASENTNEVKRGVNKLYWSCELPLRAENYKISIEASLTKDSTLLDFWQGKTELTVLPCDEFMPAVQGVINIPTKFQIDHE